MSSPFGFFNSIYGTNQSSRLIEQLKNESAKLEDILDEDALPQDFRDGKAQVVN